MTTTTRLPPRPAVNGPRPKLTRIAEDIRVAPRIIINAVEGWGKTSCGAYAPKPAILMSRGETGYETLYGAKLVPAADCVELTTWPDVLATVDQLTASDNQYGCIVLDALNGFERLCHEHICEKQFGGDWGERGFGSFQKGYDVSLTEWLGLLARLDRVRQQCGIPILWLSHSKIKPYKNPLGPDFDRYVADCHDKTWGVTHKWADTVLFGTFVTVAIDDKKTKRTKGVGGSERVVYTNRRDAYDAKNRYGMPEALSIPNDPAQVWSTVYSAIQGTADDGPPAE